MRADYLALERSTVDCQALERSRRPTPVIRSGASVAADRGGHRIAVDGRLAPAD
jgi:hypothetical protein